MSTKCTQCEGEGRYRNWSDRDVNEGWKLAPWYTCNCEAGQKIARTQHVHVNANNILQIHDKDKVYEYENGRIRKCNGKLKNKH